VPLFHNDSLFEEEQIYKFLIQSFENSKIMEKKRLEKIQKEKAIDNDL
jgi:hypothetical protein